MAFVLNGTQSVPRPEILGETLVVGDAEAAPEMNIEVTPLSAPLYRSRRWPAVALSRQRPGRVLLDEGRAFGPALRRWRSTR